jgi:hypothetical protein
VCHPLADDVQVIPQQIVPNELIRLEIKPSHVAYIRSQDCACSSFYVPN